MKKLSIIFFATLAIGLSLTSCNSNDIVSKAGDSAVAAEQNTTESDKISSETLEQGVLIDGAAKQTGNPPPPNSNLNFQIAPKQIGIQQAGVKISFASTSADIAGAYIRFKDVDGNGATSYFDIPAAVFGNKAAKKTLFEKKSRVLESKKVDGTSINVKFTSVIPAGEFCYDICIYDSANNISAIQTVCVTVEAWGGNSDVVGDWILVSDSGIYQEEINCNNGNVITIDSELYKEREIIVSFAQDGNYNSENRTESAYYDYNETQNTCTPVYEDYMKDEISVYGNWAYNEENNELFIVALKFVDLNTQEVIEEVEFGKVVSDGLSIKEVTTDRLVIEQSDSFSNQVEVFTFKRK
jgi:hypothetical protein